MQNPIKSLLESKQLLVVCILYSVFITILFLLPTKEIPKLFDTFIPIDKLVHLFIFLVLTFLWLLYVNNVLNDTKPIFLLRFYSCCAVSCAEAFVLLCYQSRSLGTGRKGYKRASRQRHIGGSFRFSVTVLGVPREIV